MLPRIGKRAFVPLRYLTPQQVRAAKRQLLFTEVSADRVSHIINEYEVDEYEYDYADHVYVQPGQKVTINECWEVRGGLSLPRAWAVEKYPGLPWKTVTVNTKHTCKVSGRIVPRDQKQEIFFERLLSAAEAGGPQNILANANTGSGKTVAAIYMWWVLGYKTLIVVDSNKIANGWIKNFRQFFGQGWTDRNVGRVQQDRCDVYAPVAIAMAQSLARRSYGRRFYRNWGMLVVDEVQVFGGPHFSPILHMFPARVRVHFTAENRGGAFGRLIQTHTGKPRVVSSQEVLVPKAYLIRNRLQQSWYAMNDGALLTGLARQHDRNEKLADLLYNRGWRRGRAVLALSNRTEQLVWMRRRLIHLGVPEDEVGIHAGTYLSDRHVVYYRIGESTKRNRLAVVESASRARTIIRNMREGHYERVPQFPAALYNRLQAGEPVSFESAREQYSPPQSELDNITHSCHIILATYEIFSKGVDVPRLDMGVELLPSGNVKQPLGRVLRHKEGKNRPEWYAIEDIIHLEGFARGDPMASIINKFFRGKSRTRRKALKKAGAEIKRA